jgi:hypothetical protein
MKGRRLVVLRVTFKGNLGTKKMRPPEDGGQIRGRLISFDSCDNV